MAFLEDDPYAVSMELEIQSIIQNLLRKRSLVRITVPGRDLSIISTILDYDRKSGTIILDNSAEDDLNTRFLRATEVKLQGLLDRVSIEFSGKLEPAIFKSAPAFSVHQPTSLRRIQRREFFRVEVPFNSSAFCILQNPSLSDGRSKFMLTDISAGGLQIIDQDNLLVDIPIGTEFNDSILTLADDTINNLKIRLQRTSKHTLESGKIQYLAGLRFVDIPRNREVAIQQFIGMLERAQTAKRWGND